jgi:hypothetical protein
MTESLVIRCDYSDAISGHVPAYRKSREGEGLEGDILEHYVSIKETAPRYLRWLNLLGQFVKQSTHLRNSGRNYVLEDFPDGYVLLEEYSPAGSYRYRADVSLWGHPSGRHFASVGEFQKHLLWLMLDTQHIQAHCACKLCKQHRNDAQAIKTQLGLPERERAPLMTGMSDVALVIMAKCRAEQARDLKLDAPIYRQFEVVKHLSRESSFIVVSSRKMPSFDNPQAGLGTPSPRVPSYTIVSLNNPYEVLEHVRQTDLAPYFAILPESGHSAAEPAYVCTTASPIAKFQLQYADEPMENPSGPKFVGFFLGPERIYCSDIVRITSRAGDRAKYKLMQISEIFLEMSSKSYKVRGDVFAFRHKRNFGAQLASVSEGDYRRIPDQILQHSIAANLEASFLNQPHTKWEVALGDVMGRDYPSCALPVVQGKPAGLASIKIRTMHSCRVDSLSEPLRSRLDELLRVSRAAKSLPQSKSGSLAPANKPAWSKTAPKASVENDLVSAFVQNDGPMQRTSPDLDDSIDEPMLKTSTATPSSVKVVVRASQKKRLLDSPHRPSLWTPRRPSNGASSALLPDHPDVRSRKRTIHGVMPSEQSDDSDGLVAKSASRKTAGRVKAKRRVVESDHDSSEEGFVPKRLSSSLPKTSPVAGKSSSHDEDMPAFKERNSEAIQTAVKRKRRPPMRTLAFSDEESPELIQLPTERIPGMAATDGRADGKHFRAISTNSEQKSVRAKRDKTGERPRTMRGGPGLRPKSSSPPSASQGAAFAQRLGRNDDKDTSVHERQPDRQAQVNRQMFSRANGNNLTSQTGSPTGRTSMSSVPIQGLQRTAPADKSSNMGTFDEIDLFATTASECSSD